MAVSALLDKWRSSSQTLGVGYRSRTRSSAVRGFTAKDVPNTTSALQDAIDAAIAAAGGDYHQADTDLPLASATAQHYGENVIGQLRYRRVLSSVDLTRTAKSQADRKGGTWSERWWRDTSSYDADGRPNGPFIYHPYNDTVPEAQRRPLSWTFRSGIMYISMTTLLDTRPSITWSNYFYRINSNIDAQWFETGAAPAKTLLFLPYTDRHVDGQYLVTWKVAYNPRKWQRYSEPVASGGSWSDSLVDLYPSATFAKVPVHK